MRSKAAFSSPARWCNGCATGSASSSRRRRSSRSRPRVADNGGVYLVPAFAGLGSPHWDPYARGAMLGLTRGTTAGHIARAALESIAYQAADLLQAMEADSGIKLAELQRRWRRDAQRPADAVSGRPAGRARGAAEDLRNDCAGRGVSCGPGRRLLGKRAGHRRQWQAERVFEPAMARDQAEALMAGWRKAVGRARDWARPESQKQ